MHVSGAGGASRQRGLCPLRQTGGAVRRPLWQDRAKKKGFVGEATRDLMAGGLRRSPAFPAGAGAESELSSGEGKARVVFAQVSFWLWTRFVTIHPTFPSH